MSDGYDYSLKIKLLNIQQNIAIWQFIRIQYVYDEIIPHKMKYCSRIVSTISFKRDILAI